MITPVLHNYAGSIKSSKFFVKAIFEVSLSLKKRPLYYRKFPSPKKRGMPVAVRSRTKIGMSVISVPG